MRRPISITASVGRRGWPRPPGRHAATLGMTDLARLLRQEIASYGRSSRLFQPLGHLHADRRVLVGSAGGQFHASRACAAAEFRHEPSRLSRPVSPRPAPYSTRRRSTPSSGNDAWRATGRCGAPHARGATAAGEIRLSVRSARSAPAPRAGIARCGCRPWRRFARGCRWRRRGRPPRPLRARGR